MKKIESKATSDITESKSSSNLPQANCNKMLSPKKKIVFITGTRADFSKIKSLMHKVEDSSDFELFVFVTGMHLSSYFGSTIGEVEKNGFANIFKFINYDKYYQMDKALATTIDGFSRFVSEVEPDLIVVHGDRIEPLAAAITGIIVAVSAVFDVTSEAKVMRVEMPNIMASSLAPAKTLACEPMKSASPVF